MGSIYEIRPQRLAAAVPQGSCTSCQLELKAKDLKIFALVRRLVHIALLALGERVCYFLRIGFWRTGTDIQAGSTYISIGNRMWIHASIVVD